MMKCKLSAILSIPAVVLSLTACSRLFPDILGSRQVRFSAKADGIATKTAYDGLVDDDGKKYAIIKWNEGDKIRVYTAEGGDIESASSSSGFCYADYALSDIQPPSGHVSGAGKITAAGSGLNWKAESGSATFYAFYPETQSVIPSGGGGLSAQVTIPSTQIETADAIADLPLVAHKTAAYGETVDLTFNAAFSTFEFIIKSDTGSGTITLNSVTLSTKEDPGNTAYLAGTGEYNIGTGAFTYGASKFRAVTVSFPTPKVITESEGATFTLFTFPVDMSQMTLTVNYTKDGNLVEKHLDLNKGGAPIAFHAGCYSRILGLALPDTGIRLFLGNVSVDNLIDTSHEINY